MRCHEALERIASLAEAGHLSRHPGLSEHLRGCPACDEAWRRHGAVLELLSAPKTLPDFADVAPAVLAGLEARPASKPSWQLAAAVALAVVALTLGYLFGQMSAGASPATDSMAATYQAAFTGQSANSAELAYLEAGARNAGAAPARSAP